MRKLTIGNETISRIKIEEIEEIETSFFREQYKMAFEIINDIVSENGKKINKLNEAKNKKIELEDSANNIIAFVGERGAGKTSAMKSFINMIEKTKQLDIDKLNNDIREEEEKDFIINLKESLEKVINEKYYITDVIDPSIFNKDDSIIEIIVAELFRNFKEQDGEFFQREENIKLFQNVYNDLRVINKEKSKVFDENTDNIEVLLGLSSAVSLQKNLYNLIDKNLKFYKKNFLIIPIDDLDMNLSTGTKMLEDIRKYLCIPNVIIVMATKITQLTEVIKQKNIIDLNKLVDYKMQLVEFEHDKYKEEFYAFDNEINNKTEKYLKKLIPISRRITLPQPITDDFEIIIKLNENENSYKDLIKYIKKLFYDKLRIILFSEETIRTLIPSNLRDFNEFIYNMNKMEDIYEGKYYYEFNAKRFKEMIINGYMTSKDILVKELIDRILNCDLKKLNKIILIELNKYISLATKNYANPSFGKYIKELSENIIYLNQENISYGDVITWIFMYEGIGFINKEQVELIKVIYSLRLLEAFDKKGEELIEITGTDYVGNYFDIVSTKSSKAELKVFREQVEIIDKYKPFSINLDKQKYSKFIQKIHKVNSDDEKRKNKKYQEYNIQNDITLVNIPLKDILDVLNKEVYTDEEWVNLNEELKSLIENIYCLYSCLEPRYEKGELYKFNLDDIYYEYSIKIDTSYGLKRKYYFKPFNLLISYMFKMSLFNRFLERFHIENFKNDSSDCELKNTFIIYFLNVEAFMYMLKEVSKSIKGHPNGSVNNRISFYLKQAFDKIKDVLKEHIKKYQEDINKENKNIENEVDNMGEIMSEKAKFLCENIKIINRLGVIGNFKDNIKYITSNLDNICDYVKRKTEQNTGRAVSNYILSNSIRKLDNVSEEYKEIIEEELKKLDNIRIDIGRTEPDKEEREPLINEFISVAKTLKGKLEKSFDDGGDE